MYCLLLRSSSTNSTSTISRSRSKSRNSSRSIIKWRGWGDLMTHLSCVKSYLPINKRRKQSNIFARFSYLTAPTPYSCCSNVGEMPRARVSFCVRVSKRVGMYECAYADLSICLSISLYKRPDSHVRTFICMLNQQTCSIRKLGTI